MNESDKLVIKLDEIRNVVPNGKRHTQYRSDKRYDVSMSLLEAIRSEETDKGSFSMTVDEVVEKADNNMYEPEVSRWGIGVPNYSHSDSK